MPRPNTSEIDQEKKQPMKAKLVAYDYLCTDYLCTDRSGSIRTDSLQVVQTQRL